MRGLVFALLGITVAACSLVDTGEGGVGPGSDAAISPRLDAPSDAPLAPGVDATHSTDATHVENDASPDAAQDAGGDHVSPPPVDASEAASETTVTTAGDALQFDGTNYVDAGTLPLPTNFTLEAWIKPTSAKGEVYVMAQDERDDADAQFRFGLVKGGQVFFFMSDSSGGTHGLDTGSGPTHYQLLSSSAVSMGSWTHIAVTKNGAVFNLLVGTSMTTTYTADAAFSPSTPAVDFRVGARVAKDGSSADGGFEGTIDEVRFWNAPQDNASIDADMTSEIAPSAGDFGQLFLYYRFDDGSGLSASDTTGHYPGTLVGTPTPPKWVTSGAF
jgi:hypothetical protein